MANPLTGEVMICDEIAGEKIKALSVAIGNVRGASPGYRRDAMRRHLIERGTAVTVERDRLEEKLNRGWVWLDQHPDHPNVVRREALWLRWLTTYQQLSDALIAAKEVL